MELHEEVAVKLIDLIPQIRQKVSRPIEKKVQKLGIANFFITFLLSETGPMTMGEIARCLTISPQQATQLADKLIADGWVFRNSDENDRRIVYIELTQDGKQKIKSCIGEIYEIFSDQLSKLDKDLLSRVKKAADDFSEFLKSLAIQI